jgi:hypothetical protein
MKNVGGITLFFLTTVLILSVVSSVNAAIEIIDQEQEETSTCQNIFIYMPHGQEFTPNLSPLTAVEIYISTSGGSPTDDTITVNIRKSTIDGTILGTASKPLSVGFEGWLRFDFPGGIILTPGSLYVIEVSALTSSFLWCAQGPDPYPGGRAILDGTPSSGDKAFRTYSLEPTVGGITLPTNTLAILTPYLALAGLIIAVSTVYVIKKRKD